MSRSLTLFSAALLFAGCHAPEQPKPSAVLVCTVNGQQTYRSQPAKYWTTTDGGAWYDWNSQMYRQSAWESCHTEPDTTL
jgi:hypothetical protein